MDWQLTTWFLPTSRACTSNGLVITLSIRQLATGIISANLWHKVLYSLPRCIYQIIGIIPFRKLHVPKTVWTTDINLKMKRESEGKTETYACFFISLLQTLWITTRTELWLCYLPVISYILILLLRIKQVWRVCNCRLI